MVPRVHGDVFDKLASQHFLPQPHFKSYHEKGGQKCVAAMNSTGTADANSVSEILTGSILVAVFGLVALISVAVAMRCCSCVAGSLRDGTGRALRVLRLARRVTGCYECYARRVPRLRTLLILSRSRRLPPAVASKAPVADVAGPTDFSMRPIMS